MTNYFLPNRIRFYQSANTDAKTIKDDFLVRINEFDVIMDDIRNQPMKGSVQHFLLLGRRGSGKSTLIKRIQVEIEEDAALAQKYIAINLAEEQANIFRLFDLMEEIATELEQKLEIEIKRPDINADAQGYTRDLFSIIHNTITSEGKKIVLLLDNIDRIFENIKDDAGILREILLNYDDLKIIGGSTRFTEHFWKYDMPFYEFFRVLELKPLTSAEIKSLLLRWSEKLNLPTLAEFVHTRSGQLEAVRILTDGMPRTLLFFVNVLLTSKQETGYEYLRQIMDYVTPQYQERLNNLAPAHRKIVLNLAFIWEAAGTGEIAAVTQMKNNVVSAQLKELVRLNIVEIVPTQNRNNLYRISERFFNLWLIFTQGSPRDKKRAKCLTIFLENFYDGDGLNTIALQHELQLEEYLLSSSKTDLLTKANAKSNYSEREHQLVNKTQEMKDIEKDILQETPQTMTSIIEDVGELIVKKQWGKAIKRAEELEPVNGIVDYLIGEVYRTKEENDSAIRFYQKAIVKGNTHALIRIAMMYYLEEKYEQSESFLLKAFHKGDAEASLGLGLLYSLQEKYEQSVKFLEKAIANGLEMGIRLLIWNYYTTGKNKERALELLPNDSEMTIMPAMKIGVKAWNGNIKEAIDETNQLIDKKDFNSLPEIFKQLLYHHQVNYVYSLFMSEQYGPELRERLEPLYYATALLLGRDENMTLRIPPEIQGTVSEILAKVKEKRKLYYGS